MVDIPHSKWDEKTTAVRVRDEIESFHFGVMKLPQDSPQKEFPSLRQKKNTVYLGQQSQWPGVGVPHVLSRTQVHYYIYMSHVLGKSRDMSALVISHQSILLQNYDTKPLMPSCIIVSPRNMKLDEYMRSYGAGVGSTFFYGGTYMR